MTKRQPRAAGVVLSGEEIAMIWEALDGRIDMLQGHDPHDDDDEIQTEVAQLLALQKKFDV